MTRSLIPPWYVPSISKFSWIVILRLLGFRTAIASIIKLFTPVPAPPVISLTVWPSLILTFSVGRGTQLQSHVAGVVQSPDWTLSIIIYLFTNICFAGAGEHPDF